MCEKPCVVDGWVDVWMGFKAVLRFGNFYSGYVSFFTRGNLIAQQPSVCRGCEIGRTRPRILDFRQSFLEIYRD